MPVREYFSEAAAADYLGITRAALRARRRKGLIRYYQPKGSRPSYRRRDLDSYMENGAVDPIVVGMRRRRG